MRKFFEAAAVVAILMGGFGMLAFIIWDEPRAVRRESEAVAMSFLSALRSGRCDEAYQFFSETLKGTNSPEGFQTLCGHWVEQLGRIESVTLVLSKPHGGLRDPATLVYRLAAQTGAVDVRFQVNYVGGGNRRIGSVSLNTP